MLTGTLTIDIEDVKGTQVSAHMDMSWTEHTVAGSGVPGVPVCGFPGAFTSGTYGFEYNGSATALQMIKVESGADGANTITRTQGFAGAAAARCG